MNGYQIGDTMQWPPHLGTVIEVTDKRVRVEWDDGMVGVFLIHQAPKHALCAMCSHSLRDSPSSHFCSERCQNLWNYAPALAKYVDLPRGRWADPELAATS